MIILKSQKEIKILREGGKILAQTLELLKKNVKPGVTTKKLDQIAEKFILKKGAKPSFKGYRNKRNTLPFPTTICASVNEQLVHTPASHRILKEGDILSLDVGVKYKGLYTDAAITIPVGRVSKKIQKLIKVTQKALFLAIDKAKPGNFLGDISYAIQNYVESQGFNVIRELVGHGVGKKIHEDPKIPNFGKPGKGIKLKEGMVLAIEPMVSTGSPKIKFLDDGWTVVMNDGSLCAHFEHSVALLKSGPLILTLP